MRAMRRAVGLVVSVIRAHDIAVASEVTREAVI